MSDMSNYLENAIGNHVLRNVAMTSPTTVYLAVYTAVTDAEAGTGTEVSTGGGSLYARIAITFPAPTNGVFTIAVDHEFAAAGTNWGDITHACLRDAVTAGNALSIVKALATTRTINIGDVLRFKAGELSFTFA